ncbi:MAG: AMP-binding protein [Candidatus Eremiobacteraeota bacterium]|nr:AMP-binding protein [Candidatus Eremiobacteraeota bacterium]
MPAEAASMVAEEATLERLRALQDRHWPVGVARAPHYQYGEIPLSDYLRRHAADRPASTALVFYGAEWSYEELDRQSDRFASLLLARGVRAGDRVAVLLPNCPQFAIAFYGILKAGCVHVPVNPLFKEFELAYELEDSGAETIVALDTLMPLVRAVRAQTRVRHVFVTSFAEVLPQRPTIPVPDSIAAPRVVCLDAEDLLPALAAQPDAASLPSPDLDAPAALNYTGGTTGMPKGCVHTQRHMLYTAATTCTVATPLGPGDVALNFYPIFWIAGEDMGLVFPIFSGATLVLLARWDPVAFAAAVERHRVTVAALLVDNAVEMLDHPATAAYDLRSLQRVRVSSFVKKLNAVYRERWRERTGTTLIEAAWGMTETHTCDTFVNGLQENDMDVESRPIFVGLPVPGTDFLIRDFETRELVPFETEGEIWVRTPSLMTAYWKRPEETAAAVEDGWFATGDIGLHDERGFLHFLGRRKEMLKYRGMSVFPAEIEAFLGRHPGVAGSGVIGRPDERYGEVPVAFVVVAEEARESLTAEALEAWCRERLATFKVPEIRIADSLPMTATGKVKKDELARRLLEK